MKKLFSLFMLGCILIVQGAHALPNPVPSRNGDTLPILLNGKGSGATGPAGATGAMGLGGGTGPGGPIGPTGTGGTVGPQGSTGTSGATGTSIFGSTGPAGSAGTTGPTGPTGDAGTGSSESIIPYASGLPVIMNTAVGGSAIDVALIGFGTSAGNIPLSGPAIDLTGGAGTDLCYAFCMPQDGTITSISAYFSNATGVDLDESIITVTAQLFTSGTPDSNTFTLLSGATVNLAPPLAGTVAVGATSNGIITGLSLFVPAQTRLLMVFSINNSVGFPVSINGYTGAGVSIIIGGSPPP